MVSYDLSSRGDGKQVLVNEVLVVEWVSSGRVVRSWPGWVGIERSR